MSHVRLPFRDKQTLASVVLTSLATVSSLNLRHFASSKSLRNRQNLFTACGSDNKTKRISDSRPIRIDPPPQSMGHVFVLGPKIQKTMAKADVGVRQSKHPFRF